jgi:hypothetical protein
VPKAIVNAARIMATHNALSSRICATSIRAGMMISGYCTRIVKLLEIAFSCSEM